MSTTQEITCGHDSDSIAMSALGAARLGPKILISAVCRELSTSCPDADFAQVPLPSVTGNM